MDNLAYKEMLSKAFQLFPATKERRYRVYLCAELTSYANDLETAENQAAVLAELYHQRNKKVGNTFIVDSFQLPRA